MRLSPLLSLAALVMAAALPAAAAQTGQSAPSAQSAKPAKPAPPQASQTKPLAPGQVAVKVQCRGMPDGTLKECKALDSKPKNPEAEQAAVQLASQQRGKPPADWPAEGRVLVLPLVLTPNKAGS